MIRFADPARLGFAMFPLPLPLPLPHIRTQVSMRVQMSTPTPLPPPPTMQSTPPLPIVAQMTPLPISVPPLPSGWRVPRLMLQVKDVCHPGAVKYFSAVNTESLLREAVVGVLKRLYTYETAPVTYASLLASSVHGHGYSPDISQPVNAR